MRFDEEENDGEEDMIDDEKMIEIAENTLVKIAESLVHSGK